MKLNAERKTQNAKLRVAVIGVGHLGSSHARIYSELKDIELVGVCDVDRSRAKKIARSSRSQAFTNYQELFGKVDAVSIVVPTNLHFKVAQDFLNHRVHALIEKPMTTTVEEADKLLSLAQEKDLILQVGHVERFNAAVRTVENLAKKPRFITCERLGPFKKRATDVSVVLDLMIHDIDIILGLVKSPVGRIEAVGLKVLTGYEDIANARITFENKTVCDLTASRVTRNETRKIRVFAEDAYISLDYIKQAALIHRKEGERITHKRIDIKKEEPLKRELEAFAACVRDHEQPLVSGKEGRDALKVALEVEEKIKEEAVEG